MPIYNKESKLNEPLKQDPSLIQVIGRFGISIGVGDATIREICYRHDLDAEFFLAVINTYLNSNYYPELISGPRHLETLLDYLRQTDSYYREVQLPNIDRHFQMLMAKSICPETTDQSNLPLLLSFYQELRREMVETIISDIENWFPALRNGDKGACLMINEYLERSHNLEEKISDLISFFIIHLKGYYDSNLCVAVVSAISILAKDMRQNNRIRERILKPLCQK